MPNENLSKQALREIKETNFFSFYCNELGGLARCGENWFRVKGLCPFHNDKYGSSLHVNITTGKYHCFSCGSKGNIIKFIMNKYNLKFSQAVKKLRTFNADTWLKNKLDNNVYKSIDYCAYSKNEDNFTLDGVFSVEDLRLLVKTMEEYKERLGNGI